MEHSDSSSNSGVYGYSFAVRPEDHIPSHVWDFGKIYGCAEYPLTFYIYDENGNIKYKKICNEEPKKNTTGYCDENGNYHIKNIN